MLILALPDDTEPWRLARVEEEPRPQGTCKVHYYARTEAGQSVLRATWRPEYFRPDTGEDVTSDMALPRLEAYHAMVPLSAVILSGITLTAAGRLRRSDVRRLSEVPLASWVCTRREGHQMADLPAPGARVAEEFTGTSCRRGGPQRRQWHGQSCVQCLTNKVAFKRHRSVNPTDRREIPDAPVRK